MYPYLIRLGDLSVPAYPVLYGLGITLGFVVVLVFGAKEGLEIRKLAHLIPIVALSCIIGGRLFYVLHHVSEFRGNWTNVFKLSEPGQVFYGGLLLGIPSVLLFCKWACLPRRRVLDLMAVGVPAGLSVGRLPCFCRGCCWGRLSELPWAMKFPKYIDLYGNTVGSPPFVRHLDQGLITEGSLHSLPVHPAQIYSSLLCIVVFLIMLWFWKTKRAEGRLLLVYLVFYALARFTLEFFRDNQMAFGGLTIAQVLSIVIGGIAAAILLIRHRIKPQR